MIVQCKYVNHNIEEIYAIYEAGDFPGIKFPSPALLDKTIFCNWEGLLLHRKI